MRRILRILALVLAPLVLTAAAPLAEKWHGFWTAPEGWLYEAEATIDASTPGKVTGAIQWTLRKSPRPGEQAKLGLMGIEFVRGEYLPEAGLLRLEGWSLEDPNKILGTDKYRLVLSDSGAVLGGITYHHGPWTGQILLEKR